MRKRLRSTIKWGGTVLTVLLLVLWWGSAWMAFGIDHTPQFGASVIGGRVSIDWFENGKFPPRTTEWKGPVWHQAPFRLGFRWQRSTNPWGVTSTHISLPIWSLVLLAGLSTVLTCWRLGTAPAIGHCINCAYDLRGVAHEVCPECGSALPVRSASGATDA
ncbi:MAG: hypothetical protein IT430_09175 [Phycisphaerales bacterium]|nr:hypothetical protein [Phycisphaerales bacterium]